MSDHTPPKVTVLPYMGEKKDERDQRRRNFKSWQIVTDGTRTVRPNIPRERDDYEPR